eukprot:jgi/Astpho2/6447/e_gw1.00094.25.1_t
MAHLLQTETCKSWQAFRRCRFGNRCQFAHGDEEIRPLIRHPKYKTEASIEPCWALHDWPVHILQNDHAALLLPCSSAGLSHLARLASMETGALAVGGSSRCVCTMP